MTQVLSWQEILLLKIGGEIFRLVQKISSPVDGKEEKLKS
jgi:hypothetical protein